jgi:carboxylate-amine ligase
MPPTFKNWQDFTAFFKSIKSAKIVETFHDLHWDLRLQPDLGTLEIRVMDTQPTLKEALMLAAFVHSLTVYLQSYWQRKEEGFLLIPNHWWLEKENYFQASHLGLEANYIEDAQGRSRPIKKVIADILDSLVTTAGQLGETEYLELVREHLQGIPSYDRQRNVWQATGSLQEVVASLLRELKQEMLSWPVPKLFSKPQVRAIRQSPVHK